MMTTSSAAQHACVFLVTCEHGGSRVPAKHRHLFRGHEALLKSHRGSDIGSLALARRLARSLGCPLMFSTTTRLLVDLNRSIGHRQLFSQITAPLAADEKQTILDVHYYPYRRAVEALLAQYVDAGRRAIHVSVHTFTPVWKGTVRTADVGLLYDPRRSVERSFCTAWLREIRQRMGQLRVRRNYPYLGRADGLTTALRRLFSPQQYWGIELEVNQRWPCGDARDWQRLQMLLAESLSAVPTCTSIRG